jgi:hypothetical protein
VDMAMRSTYKSIESAKVITTSRNRAGITQ